MNLCTCAYYLNIDTPHQMCTSSFFPPSLNSLKALLGLSCQIIAPQSAYGKCVLSTIHFSGTSISFPKGVP